MFNGSPSLPEIDMALKTLIHKIEEIFKKAKPNIHHIEYIKGTQFKYYSFLYELSQLYSKIPFLKYDFKYFDFYN